MISDSSQSLKDNAHTDDCTEDMEPTKLLLSHNHRDGDVQITNPASPKGMAKPGKGHIPDQAANRLHASKTFNKSDVTEECDHDNGDGAVGDRTVSKYKRPHRGFITDDKDSLYKNLLMDDEDIISLDEPDN